MSHIRTISPETADGELKAAYEKVGAARGGVANILQISSLNPPAMLAHLELYKVLMFGPSPLSRAERELAAVAVSRVNHCHY